MCLKWLLDFINIKIIRDECNTLYMYLILREAADNVSDMKEGF